MNHRDDEDEPKLEEALFMNDRSTPPNVTCPKCQHEFETLADVERAADSVSTSASASKLTEDVSLSGTNDSLSRMARRGRASRISRLACWTIILFLFAGSAIAIVAFALRSNDEKLAANNPPTTNTQPGKSVTRPESAPKKPIEPDESRLVESIEDSIVQIESGGPSGFDSLGSGFVVDHGGLVATNYHVVSEATAGRVRFKNGAAYDIEGYVAIQPEDDLAILKLRDAPTSIRPLRLQHETRPAPLTDVVAIGHPHGIAFSPFDGKVSRVLSTAQLPKRSRHFLADHMRSRQDHQWIQHTAVLSEGNSGGPLLNERGEVVGINTWVDKETRFGYAIGAGHLQQLLAKRLPEVAPLEEFATRKARAAATKQRLSVERIGQLFETAKAMNWAPRSKDEYKAFQQLAWSITIARFPGSFGSDDASDDSLLEQLIREADRVESLLRREKMNAFARLTIINEHASQHVGRASEGVFFFATVKKVVSGDNGSRGMLVELAGFEQMLFIPLDGLLLNPKPNTHCLVLGINHNGRSVEYGDNPLRLISAPVIASRTILPLED